MSSVVKHTKNDFLKMRKAGKLAAETLDYINDFIKPNVTTNFLNNLCHEFIIKNNSELSENFINIKDLESNN